MPLPDLLVLSMIRPDQMRQLEAAYTVHRLDLAEDPVAFLAEVAPRIRAAVTTGGRGITADEVAALPALEIVATSSVGTDKIDLGACAARGIHVTNTPDVLTDDVADIALGLILMTRRRLVEGHAYVASGAWAQEGPFALTSALKGKKVGILGLGRIGQAIAARCLPFGMRVGYCARSEKPVDFEFMPSPQALAEWSDIFVIATPGGAQTEALVSKEVIEAIGPRGTLINIARGSVVDEAAMIAALQDGRLGSAGLDVFAREPEADKALTSLHNVALSPHHASGTVETRDAMAQLVVDNLAAHFAGAPLLTPVG
ncbi:2-hydroxyacid dehydrogenase [Pseudooceanicola sediminis]|uniref:2-hydroxyacid dehydrogenase n=1 Tax=Pseudooceanicola sediminis TaxID=2211117 RepID=A0A399J4C6_9RHOB|nr:2-hydroxyacid dehydrogenase [Pseudooceanicola sediminis]KAA2315008.1 2-hydroxyacid dehydrogenase [Puniceibacterium sp. HSS470]RII38822.1 2-hydroxyacid dehydrogenase [Pseudooceanicola sediminis]|tara:strand:+ start:864 stop:1805 length:942 start_codon:yes stop_codon:yes gene_type:complete